MRQVWSCSVQYPRSVQVSIPRGWRFHPAAIGFPSMPTTAPTCCPRQVLFLATVAARINNFSMANTVRVQVLRALSQRQAATVQEQKKLEKWDRRGTVQSIVNGRVRVKTALGNTVYTTASGIITNGDVVGQRVLVTRPAMGRAFVDAPVRG